jgi:hypothetical protein
MPGASVRLKIDNKTPVYTTVEEDGTWSFDCSDIGWLSNGLHTIEIIHSDPPYGTERAYTYVTIVGAPDEPYSTCDGCAKAPDTSCGCNLRFTTPDGAKIDCNDDITGGDYSYLITGYNATEGNKVYLRIINPDDMSVVAARDDIVNIGDGGRWAIQIRTGDFSIGRSLRPGKKYLVDVCEFDPAVSLANRVCSKAKSIYIIAGKRCPRP